MNQPESSTRGTPARRPSLRGILVPTDFSPCSQTALEHAIQLARQFGADIHLLHVVVLYAGDPADAQDVHSDLEELYAGLEAKAVVRQEEALAALSDRGVETYCAVRRGDSAASSIVEYGAEEGSDLVVLGTHGRRGIRRFLLGSVAAEVVRTAPCSVLAVHGDSSGERFQRLERIVVAYDFSVDAHKALETAVRLAHGSGAKLEVVHVVPPPVTPGLGAPVPLPSSPRRLSETQKQLSQSLVGEIPDGVEAEVRVIEGYAAGQIVEHAESIDAGLIVLGSRGLTGLHRFLLGSVAERVVRTSRIPVLIARGRSAVFEERSQAGVG